LKNKYFYMYVIYTKDSVIYFNITWISLKYKVSLSSINLYQVLSKS